MADQKFVIERNRKWQVVLSRGGAKDILHPIDRLYENNGRQDRVTK